MDILAEQGDGTVTLSLVVGDSADLTLTVDDGATPAVIMDLSQAMDGTPNCPAIIRMAIKDAPAEEANTAALTYRTSFDPAQIEVLAQASTTLGQMVIHLDKPDTEAADPSTSYKWDVEVSRQGTIRTSVGTAAIPEGGGVVVGSGTAWTKARTGDILQLTSGANAGKVALVALVTDDTHLTVENPKLTADPSATFVLRRGVHRTVVRGACSLVQGVVTA
jgi:hypothetical protein